MICEITILEKDYKSFSSMDTQTWFLDLTNLSIFPNKI